MEIDFPQSNLHHTYTGNGFSANIQKFINKIQFDKAHLSIHFNAATAYVRVLLVFIYLFLKFYFLGTKKFV